MTPIIGRRSGGKTGEGGVSKGGGRILTETQPCVKNEVFTHAILVCVCAFKPLFGGVYVCV